jgi:HlyD family secretion protein
MHRFDTLCKALDGIRRRAGILLIMANKNSSGWGKWVLLLLALGAGFGGWRWYSQREKNAAVEYRSATVARGDIVQAVTANGALTPVRNVEVGSQISGTLLDVKVDFNDRVKAGQVLAQIDPATYERALGQADAEQANATAALELAQLNFNRAKELFGNKLISKSEFDEARANLSQGEANVKMRQANVERAKVDLSRTTIYAPIDGVVITRRIEVGQTVAASLNTPTLFVIANDLAKMRIEAAVSEADVGGVTEGQAVNFTVDAFPTRQFQGTVKQVRFAANTNQNVITYTTIVEVDNADLKLRPGMTANASIIISQRKGALRIPNAALRFRPPEGAVVLGGTNAPAAAGAPKVEIATSGPFAGLPVPPWQSEGVRRRPSDDERAAYESTLTAEQKQKYQQVMAEMRARFAQGSGGGGSGGFGSGERPRRSEPEGPRSQTVYLLDKDSSAAVGGPVALKPVTIKLGISDGANTEVVDGLKEGDVVASGVVAQVAAATTPAPGGSPFGGGGGPFGGGRPRGVR